MNRLLSCVTVLSLTLSAFGCVAAGGDGEDTSEAMAAQKKAVDRTGDSCEIFQCNGLLNPYGKCSDAACSECVDGAHRAPGDGADEPCGPKQIVRAIVGTGSSSSSGSVYAP